MTATPETVHTIHVDVTLDMPLDGGGVLPVRQGIGAIRTQTEGLVVFPALTGPFEFDDNTWHVTHVGTGLRIPVAFPDEEHATAFANAGGSLAAWSEQRPKVPVETLIELAREHRGTPDQRVLDGLARRNTNTGKGGGE